MMAEGGIGFWPRVRLWLEPLLLALFVSVIASAVFIGILRYTWSEALLPFLILFVVFFVPAFLLMRANLRRSH